MASSGERRAGRTVKRGEIGELNTRPCYDRETGTQKCKQFGSEFLQKSASPGVATNTNGYSSDWPIRYGSARKFTALYGSTRI